MLVTRLRRRLAEAVRPEGHLGERLRTAAAVLVTVGLVVAAGVALHSPEPSDRKLVGEVIGLHMYAHLDPPPTTSPVDPDTDTSRAADGADGYRHAVAIKEPGRTCDVARQPVDCGAKLEIFRRGTEAARRVEHLAAEGRQPLRRGALVLRLSPELQPERRRDYETAFERAVDELEGLAGVARLDR